jgi:hypothetical protein
MFIISQRNLHQSDEGNMRYRSNIVVIYNISVHKLIIIIELRLRQ